MKPAAIRIFGITFGVLLILMFAIYWLVPFYASRLADQGVRAENLSSIQKLLIESSNELKNNFFVFVVMALIVSGLVAALSSPRTNQV